MATMIVCAVYDDALHGFIRPFCVPHVGIATRDFRAQVLKPKDGANPVAMTPEDYSLFELGVWDETSGKFELLDVPKLVVKGSSLKES